MDDPAAEYEFKIKFMDEKGNQLYDDFAYTRYNADGSVYQKLDEAGNVLESGEDLIVWNDGHFKLQAGQHVIIRNLPLGTTFTIEEQVDESKFATSSSISVPQVKGDKTISGAITKENKNITVNYKNARKYELPETGGIGTEWFVFGGGALILIALFVWRRQAAARNLAAAASVRATVVRPATVFPSGQPECTSRSDQEHARGHDAHARRGGRH